MRVRTSKIAAVSSRWPRAGRGAWTLLLALACTPKTDPGDTDATVDSDTVGDSDTLVSPDTDALDTDTGASDTDVVDTDADTDVIDTDTQHAANQLALNTIPGAVFDAGVGADLAFDHGLGGACRAMGSPGAAPQVYAIGAIDLTADGVAELVLFNQSCEDPSHPGVWLDNPIATYDPSTDRLRVIGSFLDHVAPGVTTNPFVSTASFVDLNGDGALDLVSDWNVDNTRLSDATRGYILMNDGHDMFAPPRYTVAGDGAALTYMRDPAGTIGLTDSDADGDMDLTVLVNVAGGGTRMVHLLNLSNSTYVDGLGQVVSLGFVVDVDYFQGTTPSSTYTFAGFAFDPLRPDRSVAICQGMGTISGDEFVYAFGASHGVQVARDFIAAGPTPAIFALPECVDQSLSCAAPMGGSQIRFPRLVLGALTWTDCFATSTGMAPLPVATFCENANHTALLEDGALTGSFANHAPPPHATVPLAWQIDGRFDVNVDGLTDVLVTNGEDQGPFPTQESYVYLTNPGCLDGACARYEQKFLPKGAGHAHGLLWVPVTRADGSTRILLATTSDSVSGEGAPQFLTWSAEPARRWVALQVGAWGDWSAIGAVVRTRFVDAAGQPIADAVLGQELQNLNALPVTWGFPGANSPIVLGVPDAASAVDVRVDLPGLTARQLTLHIDAISGWDRAYVLTPP